MSFINQTRNMADSDFIARLYLSGSVDEWIFKKIKTSSAYFSVSARSQHSNQRDYTRRQSTEPPKGSVPFHHHKPCIEIKFSNIPRFRHDVVFGSDPRSDITVFSSDISYHHFTLTFDDVGRLIVKDWDSRFGTEVTYDEQKKKKRSDFHWIISGHEMLKSVNCIFINLTGTVQFQIVVIHHDLKSSVYRNNVYRFKQNIVILENLFHDLDLSAETERLTEVHTPDTKEIHLKKQLDQRTFDRVTHIWNVRTEEEYAIKKLTAKTLRKGKVDINAWKNEAHVMSFISHVDMLPDNVQTSFNTLAASHNQTFQCGVCATPTTTTEIHVWRIFEWSARFDGYRICVDFLSMSVDSAILAWKRPINRASRHQAEQHFDSIQKLGPYSREIWKFWLVEELW